MKTRIPTLCLPALLPLNVLAHPGHDHGSIAAGWPGAELAALLLLAAGGIGYGAACWLRRRKKARADD